MFGFCITHILNTGCAKIWKKKSVTKRLNNKFLRTTWKSRAQLYYKNSTAHPKFDTRRINKQTRNRQTYSKRLFWSSTRSDGLMNVSHTASMEGAAQYALPNNSWMAVNKPGCNVALCYHTTMIFVQNSSPAALTLCFVYYAVQNTHTSGMHVGLFYTRKPLSRSFSLSIQSWLQNGSPAVI